MKQLLNQKGQLTMDFLFAAVLILGVSTLLGALTIALTLTEVLQYASYAGARSYLSGDLTEANQLNAGRNKGDELLRKLPFLAGAQANEWIKIQTRGAGNYETYRQELGATDAYSQFVGYQIKFSLPILGLQLPLLGPAIESPDGGDFKATVSSFLAREPSTQECVNYLQKSYQALIRANPEFQRVSQSPGVRVVPENFNPIIDNGC